MISICTKSQRDKLRIRQCLSFDEKNVKFSDNPLEAVFTKLVRDGRKSEGELRTLKVAMT